MNKSVNIGCLRVYERASIDVAPSRSAARKILRFYLLVSRRNEDKLTKARGTKVSSGNRCQSGAIIYISADVNLPA